jgi:anti-sigma factor RsiW
MSHRNISELLPWYVNDTLTLEERTAVESEIDGCAECAADVEELTSLRDYMLEKDAAVEGPSETLLAKTLARITREEHAPRSVGKFWASLAGAGWLLAALPAVAAVAIVAHAAFGPGGWFAGSTAIGSGSGGGVTDQVSNVQFEAPAGPVPVNLPALRNKVSTFGALTTRSASTSAGTSAQAAIAPTVNAPQLIRTGSISLLVADVERAINATQAVARSHGGNVLSLTDQTPTQEGVRHTAQLQIGVPQYEFDAAMAALTSVGGVQARSVSAQDVSAQIVDVQARLNNARRTESDLLKIMDRQGKIEDVLAAEQQLAQVREQVEQLDGQLQATKHQVAYSTIDVSLTDAAAKTTTVAPTGAQKLGDAWQAALRSVGGFTLGILSSMLWLVAYLPYIALVAVLAAVGWYRFGRPKQDL